MYSKTKSFEELEAWKKAHEFVLLTYKITENYPSKEQYGLISQYRRAAISIAANIAEGYRKKGKADKLRFFNISQGSLEECRYYLILSRDLNYINIEDYNKLNELIIHTSFLLNKYCQAFENN